MAKNGQAGIYYLRKRTKVNTYKCLFDIYIARAWSVESGKERLHTSDIGVYGRITVGSMSVNIY